MRNITTILSLAIMSFPSFATVELNDNLTLSGFGSTSIAKSTNETPLIVNRSIADDTCFDCDTTFGLQLDYYKDNFKASTQLVKRPQDNWGAPELEWAYIGYSIGNVELRAGRLRLPLFLASEYYYVGHAYTYARPPEELYNSLLGMTAYNGSSLVLSLELFEKYQLSITPFIGFSDSNEVDITDKIDVDINLDKMHGVNFRLSGDTFRWNLAYFNADFGQTIKLTDTIPGVPYFEMDFPDDNVKLYSLGLEYEFDALTLASEVQLSNIRNTWYASLSYRMNKFVPYVVYGENHSKATSNSSPYEGKTGSSSVLGMRYDIKYNLSMNLEWQSFKSFDGQRGSFVETPVETDAEVFSLMFNYVF